MVPGDCHGTTCLAMTLGKGSLREKKTPLPGSSGETLTFAGEFFLTLGAGNHNFALAAGHTHRLAALWTSEIAVLPILNAVQKQ